MSEADQAYESWKKTTGGNVIDDKEIFDYLRLSNKDEEALDIVTSYREPPITRRRTSWVPTSETTSRAVATMR